MDGAFRAKSALEDDGAGNADGGENAEDGEFKQEESRAEKEEGGEEEEEAIEEEEGDTASFDLLISAGPCSRSSFSSPRSPGSC